MYNIEISNKLLNLVEHLEGVTQNPDWHPEGDVLQHTLQVFYLAVKETNDIDLLWACLLHDLGKGVDCLKHTHYSVKLIEGLVSDKTLSIVKRHMRIKLYLDGKMRKTHKCQAMLDNKYFKELIMISRWDNLGRNPNIKKIYNKEEILSIFNKKLNSIKPKKNGITVMVGNIGAGKSTYISQLMEAGYVTASMDAIRYCIGSGNYTFNPFFEPAIYKIFIFMIKTFLKLGVNVRVDATNVSVKNRKIYINIAHKGGYKIKAIEMPRLSKTESIDRRMQNPHGVPVRIMWEGVWDKMDKRYVSPTTEEGFDEVIKL